MKSDKTIIAETTNWLKSIVIHFNFCPFAKHELVNNRIRFAVSHADNIETLLETLIQECETLDSDSTIETTLLILPGAFTDFDDYLGMLELAQTLIEIQGYEGIYQLASFHPDYLFEGSHEDDPANYTNRSPYPMLHLLREASLENNLKNFPNPEQIPEHNMKRARETGLATLQALLAACKK